MNYNEVINMIAHPFEFTIIIVKEDKQNELVVLAHIS